MKEWSWDLRWELLMEHHLEGWLVENSDKNLDSKTERHLEG